MKWSRCDVSPVPDNQCFVVEGSLSAAPGARVMYAGLCVGFNPSLDTPVTPSSQFYSLRLQPCSEGYTLWRQDQPGGFVLVSIPGLDCSAAPASRPVLCNVGWQISSATYETRVVNVRVTNRFGLGFFVLSGFANFTEEQVAPREL
jgi:hypothetical protein